MDEQRVDLMVFVLAALKVGSTVAVKAEMWVEMMVA